MSQTAAAAVRTRSVYEPADPSDGRRILVTRYWPRGVPRTAVHEYVRLLAPTRELLRTFRDGGLAWDDFRQQYAEQMDAPEAQQQIRRLAEQASTGPITLLCVCKDAEHCHRTLLQELVVTLVQDCNGSQGRLFV